MMNSSDVLIYDIESRIFGKPDPKKDLLRLFLCYSYKTKKYYVLKSIKDIQKVINAHKYLVGFNVKEYDNPILIKEGVKLDYKIIIDMFDIFKKRSPQMKVEKGMLGDVLMSYSLDFISKTIGIVGDDTGKIKIDYNIFKKKVWSEEELDMIIEYGKRDVEVTKKMYEWLENYFEAFKGFLNEEDVRKKVYLTASLAKVTYKAICKAMNWSEKYAQNFDMDDDRIEGGYVSYPSGNKFSGNIYCMDFRSLYPHIMIQANLYGHNLKDDGRPIWEGGEWELEGKYYSDTLAGVGTLLKKWFGDRIEYKIKGDRREYTIKIMLNVVYGILDMPYYIRTYDKVAAGDCTRLGRQWIKLARKLFKEAGYTVCYTDTDSVYVIDNFGDKEKMLKVKDKIIAHIKDSVPFAQDTFDMGIDDEIMHLYFFKGRQQKDEDESKLDEEDLENKKLGLLKKNYIYVRTDGEVEIKNLGIKKKSNSALSKKIFWDYMVPEIKEGTSLFKKSFIQNIMLRLLNEDISLAALRKDVGSYEQYAKTSPNSLQAQIAKRYGSGIHFMVPNILGRGVGKGKKFCTLEEFKENNMKMEHIDLTNFWKELEYFIKPIVMKNIFEFGK